MRAILKSIGFEQHFLLPREKELDVQLVSHRRDFEYPNVGHLFIPNHTFSFFCLCPGEGRRSGIRDGDEVDWNPQ